MKYELKVFRIEIFLFVKISTEHETGGSQSDRLGEIQTLQTILTASASASAPV